MKKFITFLAGVVAGVAGVTLYQIYGKPTLPKEPYLNEWEKEWLSPEEDKAWRYLSDAPDHVVEANELPSEVVWHKKDEYPPAITHSHYHIPAADSIDDMGITQEIEIHDET